MTLTDTPIEMPEAREGTRFGDADVAALRGLPQAEREAGAWRLIAQGEFALHAAGESLAAGGIETSGALDLSFIDDVDPPQPDVVYWDVCRGPKGRTGLGQLSAHEAALVARFRSEASKLALRLGGLLQLVGGLDDATLHVAPRGCHLSWISAPAGVPEHDSAGTFRSGTGTLSGDVAALQDARAAARRLEGPGVHRYRIHSRCGNPPYFGHESTRIVVGADVDDVVQRLLAFERRVDLLRGDWSEGKDWEGRRLLSIEQLLDADAVAGRLQSFGARPSIAADLPDPDED